jgi:hypothetical protein
MPRYTVTFERTITSIAERTVRARNEEEARAKAEEMVSQITDWKEQDDDIQVSDVMETD